MHEYFDIDYENAWRIKNENMAILSTFIKRVNDDSGN